MQLRLLTGTEELATYDRWVQSHPQGTLWQSLAWKKLQETLGRTVRIYRAEHEGEIVSSALVVIDRTSLGFSTWDIPRGPLASSADAAKELVAAITEDARHDRCLALYLSPLQPCHLPRTQASDRHEQPDASRVIDLTLNEEALLAQMHPKGRYNIKVAQKHGVSIEASTDIEAFYRLLRHTGERDQFGIRPLAHYKAFLSALPGSFLLLAFGSPTERKEPIAGLLGVSSGKTAYYYYGASSYAHRSLMAPYLLQWAAMQQGKSHGCTSYDLLGVAPPDAPPNHPWAGVSTFKEKFGGSVVTYPREQQIVLRPTMNAILRWKRRILG